MAADAITEAGEDNNLFTAGDDVTNTFRYRTLLGLVQRRPDLHQPRQEFRVIWLRRIGSGIPGEETFDGVEGSLAARDIDRHPAPDLGRKVKDLPLRSADRHLLHQKVQFIEIGGPRGHPSVVIAICIAITLGEGQK